MVIGTGHIGTRTQAAAVSRAEPASTTSMSRRSPLSGQTEWMTGIVESRLACMARPPSGRLVEQLAADQHAPDLTGAGADLVELGIAQQPPGRVLVDVAVAAQRLDRFERHPGGLLCGEEDRTGCVLAGRPPLVAGSGHGVDISPGGVHHRVHVGNLRLHELELADRLAELLAVVDIR